MGDGEGPRGSDWVIDLDRAARPGDPPVPGAQWDELHERWEFWDEASQSWHSVDAEGRHATRPEAVGLQPLAPGSAPMSPDEETEDERPHILDLDRLAEPAESVPGAQWNEVVGRWERWDESAEAWVEARA